MSSSLPIVIQTLRFTHILAGFVAFFIAPIPLLTVKGGRTHRRWGQVYFWAMAIVAASAIVLSLWRPILFLAFVAVFSFYVAFRGYRVLYRKNPAQGQGPKAIDWTAAVLAFLGGIALIALGIVRPSLRWLWPSVVGVPGILIWVAYYHRRFALAPA
jgi:uncharacterized membrane protein